MTKLANPLDRTIEDERFALQARLDAGKTRSERNELGQFATPTELARDILEFASDLLAPAEPIRFLDPAIGTGAFFSALLDTIPVARIERAIGFEIDPHYGEPARRLWAGTLLDLRLSDFTAAAVPAEPERANLVVCNPPYVRHHHLGADDKRRLQARTREASGMKLSGLSGLYCHFLGQSHAWMSDGCLAGWLIPSEVLDVNYGSEVKRYLLERVELLHVHRFDPKEVQFGDALVSSMVVWFRNRKPTAGHRVRFTYGGSLGLPAHEAIVEAATLQSIPKWSRLPFAIPERIEDQIQPRLGDLFTVRRGLATGGNAFFILSPEQIVDLGLPREFFRPILPSPRNLSSEEIIADEQGNPIVDKPRFLLDCRLSQGEIEREHPTLWRYLMAGVESGVADAYLSRHRSPWYAQERRPAAPILCSYMGRPGADGRRPFRFFLNHSQATAANVYLMLYPKGPLMDLVREEPQRLRTVWHWLNALHAEALLGEGRVYGGGLHKLEPKELANLPVGSLTERLGMRLERWLQSALG